jgi:hypothetical protein
MTTYDCSVMTLCCWTCNGLSLLQGNGSGTQGLLAGVLFIMRWACPSVIMHVQDLMFVIVWLSDRGVSTVVCARAPGGCAVAFAAMSFTERL